MAIFEEIEGVLSAIPDPESKRPLGELGFIKGVRPFSDRVEVELEIPVSHRGYREILESKVRSAVLSVDPKAKIAVKFSFRVESQQDETRSGQNAGNSAAGASGAGSAGKNTGAKNKHLSLAKVKHVLAVASGKGGVGKSTVAANLACALSKKGHRVGLMDLDIYGPSISHMFGITEHPSVDQNKKLFPVEKYGMKFVSMAMFTDADSAVIWRGPMVSQMVQNFLFNVHWGEVDYLILDLPPGTGDIQLTLTQTAPLTGAIIVTTPQEISLIDAKRGLRMFEKVSVPVLGIVENMSRFVGDDGKEYYIFQKGGGQRIAGSLGVPLTRKCPAAEMPASPWCWKTPRRRSV